jgi:hypothetical protein
MGSYVATVPLMDPSTKPGSGAAPHREWRNRDYDEADEAAPPRRRWVKWVAAIASLFMLFGLLWSMIKPLAQ